MRQSEGVFQAQDGLRLFERSWRPESGARAAVVIVHGYAEHSGRYGHVARYLVERGYAVYAFDLRGHGRSGGERALVRSFDDYLIDLETFLERVKEREPGKSLFALGHSMGGEIAVLFAITRRPVLRGLVTSGALLKLAGRFSSLFRAFVFVAGRISPRFPVLKKLDCRLISHDAEVVRDYDDDPLIYRGQLQAREAWEINRAMALIQNRMRDISLPLLILHGTGDCLVDAEGSRWLYDSAGSQDKTLKLYTGFYHEVLNETGRQEVLTHLASWLDERVS